MIQLTSTDLIVAVGRGRLIAVSHAAIGRRPGAAMMSPSSPCPITGSSVPTPTLPQTNPTLGYICPLRFVNLVARADRATMVIFLAKRRMKNELALAVPAVA